MFTALTAIRELISPMSALLKHGSWLSQKKRLLEHGGNSPSRHFFSSSCYFSNAILSLTVKGVTVDGKTVGVKRPRIITPPPPPPVEQSPLVAPSSNVDQRNLYLRTIGPSRMRQVGKLEVHPFASPGIGQLVLMRSNDTEARVCIWGKRGIIYGRPWFRKVCGMSRNTNVWY